MKIPTLLIRKKKLRATTARRALVAPDEMDYEEMSEPNMKLSRALLIVLVLHVVAVAGIIAFNTIKSRQGAFPARPKLENAAATEAAAAPAAKTENNSSSQPTTAARDDGKTSSPSAKEDHEALKAKPALPVTAPADTGKVYVVVKGDNPVTIARHLKVSEADLLSINHIDDPRKLQIGQKLIIPATKKTKKNEN
jgi:LysM repeat protein